MDSSQIIQQIKSNLKFIILGILFIALLAFGFVVAITLLLFVIIAVPIIRFLRSKDMQSFKKGGFHKRREHGIDDFIDVDYEIIKKEEENKKDREEE